MSKDKYVFTTHVIESVRQKFEDGYKITRQEKYWFSNMPLVRRKGLVFSYSDEELLEYGKCKFGVDLEGLPYIDSETQTLKQTGVQYFAENYCMIKNEVGKISNMRLRNYQNDILNLYIYNRFSILCGSRQIGKCVNFTETVDVLGKKFYIFELWYDSLKHKTFIDIIKYYLYKIYVKLD